MFKKAAPKPDTVTVVPTAEEEDIDIPTRKKEYWWLSLPRQIAQSLCPPDREWSLTSVQVSIFNDHFSR